MNSKEIGTIGEYRIIDMIVSKTDGLLSCFTSFIDSCGIDIVMVNKETFKTILLQVKCRITLDRYNQFNQVIYKSTFSSDDRFYYLFVYMPNSGQNIYWFIPSNMVEANLNVHVGKKIRAQYNFSTSITAKKSKWSEFQYSEDNLIKKLLILTS